MSGHFKVYGEIISNCASIDKELSAGQEVKVENIEDSVIYGTNTVFGLDSWFTGYLLQV